MVVPFSNDHQLWKPDKGIVYFPVYLHFWSSGKSVLLRHVNFGLHKKSNSLKLIYVSSKKWRKYDKNPLKNGPFIMTKLNKFILWVASEVKTSSSVLLSIFFIQFPNSKIKWVQNHDNAKRISWRHKSITTFRNIRYYYVINQSQHLETTANCNRHDLTSLVR